jgi:hypothetical protein
MVIDVCADSLSEATAKAEMMLAVCYGDEYEMRLHSSTAFMKEVREEWEKPEPQIGARFLVLPRSKAEPETAPRYQSFLGPFAPTP